MVPFLYTPREHHQVRTPAEYEARHAQHLAKHLAHGGRARVHASSRVLTARVDCNTWLVDCECGAGNAVDPDWPPVAHCFGCGAVHRTVIFPEPVLRHAIERVLLCRVDPRLRSWRHGETVADLLFENVTLSADQLVEGAS